VELLELKAISRATTELRRAEYDAASGEVEAARQDLARLGGEPAASGQGQPGGLTIVSPRDGVILSRRLSSGQIVDRGEVIFEIADLSSVWAIVDLYERDLGQVETQGQVEIETDAHPGRVFPGRIEMVEPVLDDVARTVHLRDNQAGDLRPGMFVTMAVPVRGASGPAVMAVPVDAVQRIAGMATLFVEIEEGRYEVRPVETGREAHGMIEILQGLDPTERIVIGGAFILKSELLKSTIGGDEH
jgi:cobalt-zinc-cadmium efflux system membrane fusion protein